MISHWPASTNRTTVAVDTQLGGRALPRIHGVQQPRPAASLRAKAPEQLVAATAPSDQPHRSSVNAIEPDAQQRDFVRFRNTDVISTNSLTLRHLTIQRGPGNLAHTQRIGRANTRRGYLGLHRAHRIDGMGLRPKPLPRNLLPTTRFGVCSDVDASPGTPAVAIMANLGCRDETSLSNSRPRRRKSAATSRESQVPRAVVRST